MPGCAFELDRFTADDERLEVSGRWLGVRGRRFVRPSLTAMIDGHSTRALAELEHKPWAAEEGDEWVAAFPWRRPLGEVDEFELAVAPDLSVRLPPPNGSVHELTLPVVVPQDEPAEARPEREAAPRRGEALELREQAAAVRHNALAVRDRALAELEQAIGDRERLRTELEQASAERERLGAELERAGGERERLRAELERAGGERELLRADRERLRAELKRTATDRGRDGAELDHVARERERLRAELGSARAELRTARSDLVLARQATTAQPVLPALPAPPLPSAPAPVRPPAPVRTAGAATQRRIVKPRTWGVRALTIAVILTALVLLLITVLTSGPASVAGH